MRLVYFFLFLIGTSNASNNYYCKMNCNYSNLRKITFELEEHPTLNNFDYIFTYNHSVYDDEFELNIDITKPLCELICNNYRKIGFVTNNQLYYKIDYYDFGHVKNYNTSQCYDINDMIEQNECYNFNDTCKNICFTIPTTTTTSPTTTTTSPTTTTTSPTTTNSTNMNNISKDTEQSNDTSNSKGTILGVNQYVIIGMGICIIILSIGLAIAVSKAKNNSDNTKNISTNTEVTESTNNTDYLEPYVLEDQYYTYSLGTNSFTENTEYQSTFLDNNDETNIYHFANTNYSLPNQANRRNTIFYDNVINNITE